VQKNATEDDRAENVMFIITTDGMENASREYRLDKIKAMIEEQKEKDGWEFLFIGANINAVETASSCGISPDRAVNYSADSHGVKAKYMAMRKAISYTRKSMPISSSWKDDLERDDRDRRKKPDPVKGNVNDVKKKD